MRTPSISRDGAVNDFQPQCNFSQASFPTLFSPQLFVWGVNYLFWDEVVQNFILGQVTELLCEPLLSL